MIQTQKIKGRMRELGKSQATAARVLGLHPATFNKKLNGTDGACFTVDEAEVLAQLLKLIHAEKADYFFWPPTCE